MSELIGQIHDKNTVFMHVHIGTAKDEGDSYELTHGLMHTPIVKNLTTGKYFTLSWEDILKLAIKAGINEAGSNSE